MTGTARQQEYDPFADPGRAAGEEFGEVFAIGLHYLIRSGDAPDDGTFTFWRLMLQRRDRALEGLVEKLRSADIDHARKERMGVSLRAARDTLAMITPDLCEGYLRAWQRDRGRWAKHVDQMPTNLSVDRALAELGFAQAYSNSATGR